MKILLLPGASDSNRQWADDWAGALSARGYEVKALYYGHWGKEEMFSLEHEIAELKKLHSSWRNTCIIAKSIGAVLAVFAFDKGVLMPQHAVFLGFPTELDGQKDATMVIDIRKWMASYTIKTTVFQNEHDPVTSYNSMKRFVENTPSIVTVSVPGDTHKYVPGTFLTEVLAALK